MQGRCAIAWPPGDCFGMTSVPASTLAHRVVGAPRAPRSDCSGGRLKAWLADLGSGECVRELKRLFDTHPAVTQLINAIAEGSPFLWELVRVSPQRLLSFLTT